MERRIREPVLWVNTEKELWRTTLSDTLSVLRDCPVSVRLPERLQSGLSDICPENVRFCGDRDIFDGADCVLILGGDGSVIKAAGNASVRGIPVLGINLGRVGYLAEVERGELDLLRRLCRGDYRIERRMMLSVSVMRDGETVHTMRPALNDAVISNGTISHMVDLSVSCGERYVASFHADGVIAATPTGSTAYSMSAGGPIIDPTLDCICLTPVCSHSLGARPMLFAPDSDLGIRNICTRENNVYLTVDGDENFKLLEHDIVYIRKSKTETKMIRFSDNGFYSLLNRKLGKNES